MGKKISKLGARQIGHVNYTVLQPGVVARAYEPAWRVPQLVASGCGDVNDEGQLADPLHTLGRHLGPEIKLPLCPVQDVLLSPFENHPKCQNDPGVLSYLANVPVGQFEIQQARDVS